MQLPRVVRQARLASILPPAAVATEHASAGAAVVSAGGSVARSACAREDPPLTA